MPTLLHLDSSPLGDHSISRELTRAFVGQWQLVNPSGTVFRRDLTISRLPLIDAEWINASFTPEPSRTPEQRELLETSDQLIRELETADEYVLGVPMHNFTIASVTRLWIDLIVRAGRIFAYVDGTPTGLLAGKKASILLATGADYSPGTPMAAWDFAAPYLRSIFRFIGVEDIRLHVAGGAAAVRFGKVDRETFLKPHLDAIRAGLAAA